MVAAFLGRGGMGFFNHTIDFPIQRERVRLARIGYDDAFAIRRSILLKFANSVESVRVGGTASSDVVIHQVLITEYDESREHIVALSADQKTHTCVRCPDEHLRVGQAVLMVEHMDHRAGRLWSFNKLVTARVADFRLNSICVTGLDAQNQEVARLRIDPYTGQVNYDDVDSTRL